MENALSFHDDAEKRFNEVGEQILKKVERLNNQQAKRGERDEWPRRTGLHTIKLKETESLIGLGACDIDGNQTERRFVHNGVCWMIKGDNIRALDDLTSQIHKLPKWKDSVSKETIGNSIASWVKASQAGDTRLGLCSYLVELLSSEVLRRQVWVPIAGLEIQKPIDIGDVTLRPILPAHVDEWQQRALQMQPDNAEPLRSYFHKLRKRYVGKTVGEISIVGEREYVFQRATDAVERAVSLIRFFSPANFRPTINCNATLMGRQLLRRTTILEINDAVPPSESSSADKSDIVPWRISSAEIDDWKNDLFQALGVVQRGGQDKSFVHDLGNALLLYSRVSTSKRLSDKVIFLFSAIESILLKNEGEPIQFVVSERMATLLGGNTTTKQEIIARFKRVYSKRSQTVHHAISPIADQDISSLMHDVWRTLCIILLEVNDHSSKREFLDRVEEMRLGSSL